MRRHVPLLIVALLLSACGSSPTTTPAVTSVPLQTAPVIVVPPTQTIEAPTPTWVPTVPLPSRTPPPSVAHIAAAKGANVRNVPSTTGSVVLVALPHGAAVTLLGATADHTWYHITTAAGVTGWISAPLLTIDANGVPPVPSEPPAATIPAVGLALHPVHRLG